MVAEAWRVTKYLAIQKKQFNNKSETLLLNIYYYLYILFIFTYYLLSIYVAYF